MVQVRRRRGVRIQDGRRGDAQPVLRRRLHRRGLRQRHEAHRLQEAEALVERLHSLLRASTQTGRHRSVVKRPRRQSTIVSINSDTTTSDNNDDCQQQDAARHLAQRLQEEHQVLPPQTPLQRRVFPVRAQARPGQLVLAAERRAACKFRTRTKKKKTLTICIYIYNITLLFNCCRATRPRRCVRRM